jgi:hypothetical protein
MSNSVESISKRNMLADDVHSEISLNTPELLCSSVQTIANSLGIPAWTIYSHLAEKTGFRVFLLHWVPHILTEELRQKPVELAG